MKNRFRSYLAVWAICLAVFNVTAFVPTNKFGPGFFVGYAFITAAFIGQLFCSVFVFKRNNPQKLFYNLPIASISFIGLIVMLLFGGLSMAIPRFPVTLGVVVCFAVLDLTAIAVIGAGRAAEAVENIDRKTKSDTAFIKMLVSDAETLMAKAETRDRDTVKKVYEALRFSDPVGSPALASVEAQINLKFKEFQDAVISRSDAVKNTAGDLLILIADRNSKCKLLK